MKQEAKTILLAVVLACLTMVMVETVFLPGYVIKSAVKLVLFVGTMLMFGGKGLFRGLAYSGCGLLMFVT